jgi:hypothetical protein
MRSIALGLLAALAFLDFVSAKANPRYSHLSNVLKKRMQRVTPLTHRV